MQVRWSGPSKHLAPKAPLTIAVGGGQDYLLGGGKRIMEMTSSVREECMPRGISTTYYSFREDIRENSLKFAFLQLAGRMEDLLVKEFAYHIWHESEGNRYPMTNAGNKGEQKFDIVILRGSLGKTKKESQSLCEVCTLVEAKYVQRRHRAFEGNANDETKGSLESLRQQLGKFNADRQYGFQVKLHARKSDVYGLVIASYVATKSSGEAESTGKKERFFKGVKEDAKGLGFRYLDFPYPRFDKVYDDVEVALLKGRRFCSLRMGLWKLT